MTRPSRSERPFSRASVRTSSSTGRSSSAKTGEPSASFNDRSNALGRTEELDPDLAVVRADRRLDAFRLPAELRERLSDWLTRLRRKSAAPASLEVERFPTTRLTASSSSAARQSRRSSGGGPGRTTATAPSVSTTSPGAVPAIPITRPPAGTVACFRTPASNSAYGRLKRSAIRLETSSISCSSSGSTRASSPAARARSSTVRSSWVGPSPPEITSRSAVSPSRIASSNSDASSPTTVIRAGSAPSRVNSSARKGPFASRRPPRTSSLPVTRTAVRTLNRATWRARRGSASP